MLIPTDIAERNIKKDMVPKMNKYTTKDNGEKETFDSGFVRDVADNKPRFDLLIPEGIPYNEQILTRFAELMSRGAKKYSARNWEKANTMEEAKRCQESASRHFIQWMSGETDEDHAAAIYYNIMAYETIVCKVKNNEK
jgi:hypothetical protein